MTLFNPDKQAYYISAQREAYRGQAPALATVKRAYGDDAAESWLAIQLNDVANYTGARNDYSAADFFPAAKLLLATFGYLKLSELLLFFGLYKSGRYGRPYGTIDFISIGDALNRFVEADRKAAINRYKAEEDNERQARELAETKANAITYTEYCKLTNTKPDERIDEILQS